MRDFLRRIRLAYLKWRHPLKAVPCPALDTSTALEKYEPQLGQMVRTSPTTGDLAREYVRTEFERLLREASHEIVHIDISDVARPDAQSTEHSWVWNWQGKAGREWQAIELTIKHDGMLRVIAGVDRDDPIFLALVAHRTTPIRVTISSLLYASAADPCSVWVFSPLPFDVTHVDVRLRLDPDMIKRIREQIAEETGVLASLPAPGSYEGRKLYSSHPEYLP